MVVRETPLHLGHLRTLTQLAEIGAVILPPIPAFYAQIRGRERARDYRMEYEAGRLTLCARRIMDALVAEHPQYTRGLRASCFMLEARQTREFERAMAELQQGLWIVKTEERYEPSFSYRWDLLEHWLPSAVAAGLTGEAGLSGELDRLFADPRLTGAEVSALVTDAGGVLSHGAIVAREYGLPAVTGTRTATRQIRPGQPPDPDYATPLGAVAHRGMVPVAAEYRDGAGSEPP